MPRLLMFAPCEKVIIGQGDNSVSLIGILHGLQVNLAAEAASSIPKNAILPISWSIFSMWQKEGEDEGAAYIQRVMLVSPDGKTLLESVTQFAMEKEIHRIASGLRGLPIGEEGTHILKLSLRRTDSNLWNDISSFPMSITHPSPVRSSSMTH